MQGVKIEIIKYISNDQPGWVECKLIDVCGKEFIFHEKVPIVTIEILNEFSEYPKSGVIACQIINRWKQSNGRDIISINTDNPWGVESIDGEINFDVLPEQLQELSD